MHARGDGNVQRIQAVREEANIKLCSVIRDIMGASGRRMLKALIAGETDAAKLAALRAPAAPLNAD
jgi:transposase